uniref:Uncharacterized protein n=1 Tax=Arundo donax TaxID=35708 RepID=A0A0A9AUY2_ARUDO
MLQLRSRLNTRWPLGQPSPGHRYRGRHHLT